MIRQSQNAASAYTKWLWLLFAVFVGRVLAQIVVLMFSPPLLPPFEAWFSGAIPYPQLLLSQLLIIAVMATINLRLVKDRVTPRRSIGIVLLIFGAVYFFTMALRFLVAVMGWSELLWFNRPIPAFFHMVLASYLLMLAHFHIRHAQPCGAGQ